MRIIYEKEKYYNFNRSLLVAVLLVVYILKALKNADNEDCNNNSYNLNLTFDNNITDKKFAANYNLVVKTIAEDEEVELKINTKLEITKESSIP